MSSCERCSLKERGLAKGKVRKCNCKTPSVIKIGKSSFDHLVALEVANQIVSSQPCNKKMRTVSNLKGQWSHGPYGSEIRNLSCKY